MRNICARLYFFPQCARFAQDCTEFSNAQYMCKICTRLYCFPNVQYMRKICAKLYLFLQCALYVQDLHKIALISPMHNICVRFAQDFTYFPNAQYMRKIVLIYPMRNICARFVQDCTLFLWRAICSKIQQMNFYVQFNYYIYIYFQFIFHIYSIQLLYIYIFNYFIQLVHVPNFEGLSGWRTGVGVTTVSNSLILGEWVTKVLKNGNKK